MVVRIEAAWNAECLTADAKLGKLHEKRGEFVEAYRVYTEGIDAYKSVRERFGRTAVPRPVRRPGQQEAPEETDPAALCKALLGRLGRDYFIGEFLKGTLPALGEKDRARIGGLLALLRSDSIIDREDALEDLEKLGPAAARALQKSLKSGDAEFRSRVRQLLWTWAEPNRDP